MANPTKDSLESLHLEHLTTEACNPLSVELDSLSALEIVQLVNSEDAKVVLAVGAVSAAIATAIDVIADRLGKGGRLIYVGAGTSGRLGILDAVECPPTFNTEPDLVQGLIAGGQEGLVRAVEGAEDSRDAGREDLQKLALGDLDVVVGIAASGRTPYVIGALDYARRSGAYAIGFSCNQGAELTHHADLNIIPVVGPEVLSGSTRLKAGTATKMVLNMLTTGAMVRMGKTYSNLMVDLHATNSKLIERARRIVATLTGCSRAEAGELLKRCDGEVKTAVVVQTLGISPRAARARLDSVKGHLRLALAPGER
ncbi:MAG: N-acetylmuramic acid 6-phosphate etherase [Gammaproteobacteria bacterium]|nr:MAG: N-acetylmuramic acid 6-phosphate etherase [Gammaproteobacteria bacterium]